MRKGCVVVEFAILVSDGMTTSWIWEKNKATGRDEKYSTGLALTSGLWDQGKAYLFMTKTT